MENNYIFKTCDDIYLQNDIRILFNDMANHFSYLLGEAPLGNRNIEIFDKQENPFTYFIKNKESNYRIDLSPNLNERDYCMITYEFAHELCHIYCFHPNYEIKVNNWFIESICIMSSFYFLNYLFLKWIYNPPFPNWKNYALNFQLYKNKYFQDIEQNLNLHNLSLKKIVDKLLINGLNEQYDRINSRFIARYLYDYFCQDSNYWKILKYLPLSIEGLNDKTVGVFENSVPNFKILSNLLPNEFKYLLNKLNIETI